MGALALFCPDTRTYSVSNAVGSGMVHRLHYRAPRGFGKKRREAHLLSSLANGMQGIQPDFCARCGIPCLSGDAARLMYMHLHTLLPRHAGRVALYPGNSLSADILAVLSQRIQFLEIIGGAKLASLTEDILDETGICIPIRNAPSPGFLPVRLPGAEKGAGLDLTNPETSCRFLPPPVLRSIWPLTPKTGAALDALLTFFELPPLSAGVFLSNFTK